MRKLGAAVVLLALLAACGGDDAPAAPVKPVYPATINIQGNLTLDGANYVRGNLAECAGAGPFADLVIGAPVTVSTANGKPLAIGKIAYSVGTNVYRNQLDQCIFRFNAFGVPRSMQYSVTIARQPPVAMSFLTLLARGGVVSIQAKRPAGAVTTTTKTLGGNNPIG